MVAIGIGDRMVMMQGFARQKSKSNNPTKKARSVAFRRYVVPSETKESLGARTALAEAGIAMRGRSFEDVISHVVSQTGGKNWGGPAKAEKLKRMRYAAADLNLARMRRLAGGAHVGIEAGYASLPGLF